MLKRAVKGGRATTLRQKRRLRVVIADDHRMFLDGVKSVLERRGFEVVGVASDGEEAVRVAIATRPDVAVLDLLMPTLDGLGAARALLTSTPTVTVVLVTGSGDLGFVLEGMMLGVRGFVVKTAAIEDLCDAIKAATAGATYFSQAYAPAVKAAVPEGQPPGRSALTQRERQVLRLIAEGRTSKQIAVALHIAPNTVETYRARVMKKLAIHEVAGLVRYAIRERIASP